MSRPKIGDLIPIGGGGGSLAQSYSGNLVLDGPMQAKGKPGFIKLYDDQSFIDIVGTSERPLVLSFPNGIKDSVPENVVKAFTGQQRINFTSGGSYLLVANLQASGDVTFEAVKSGSIIYQDTASGGSANTYCYELSTNTMRKQTGSSWGGSTPCVVIGEVGVGSNNKVYTSCSYVGRYAMTGELKEFVTYDGVSAITNGQFTALNPSVWTSSDTILNTVLNSPTACDAVANSFDTMKTIFATQSLFKKFLTTDLGLNALLSERADFLERMYAKIGWFIDYDNVDRMLQIARKIQGAYNWAQKEDFSKYKFADYNFSLRAAIARKTKFDTWDEGLFMIEGSAGKEAYIEITYSGQTYTFRTNVPFFVGGYSYKKKMFRQSGYEVSGIPLVKYDAQALI